MRDICRARAFIQFQTLYTKINKRIANCHWSTNIRVDTGFLFYLFIHVFFFAVIKCITINRVIDCIRILKKSLNSLAPGRPLSRPNMFSKHNKYYYCPMRHYIRWQCVLCIQICSIV